MPNFNGRGARNKKLDRHTFTIRCSAQTLDKLKAKAAKERRTMNEQANFLLDKGLAA